MPGLFERLFAIDTRTLALFRVGLGVLLLADLVYRSMSFEALHTDAGVLPRSALALLAGDGFRLWSLHTLGGSTVFIATLFALQALLAVAVVSGFRTRIALPLSWLLLVSLQHRNPLILTGADQVLRAMLLWACFLPLGARWSIDARRAKDPSPARSNPWLGVPLLGQIPLLFTFINPTGGTPITGSLVFAPWTTGSPPLTGVAKQLAISGFVLPTFVSTITLGGSDARTPGGLGLVQLVSPVQIFVGAAKGGGYGVLTLDFVPEPGRLLGLGVGALSLSWLGARRRRVR